MTILVLEDDPFTAKRLREILKSRGVSKVIPAETIAEAKAKLAPPPDWAILDMNLPDGLGLTVLETIRQAGLPTRVIISSSTKNESLLAEIAGFGPCLILPKPLDPALLPF